jgi:hypothetical protein
MVQITRRLDRRSLAGAIEDIKAQQLFLGLGERAVEQQAITRPAQGVASSRAAGPSCPSFVRRSWTRFRSAMRAASSAAVQDLTCAST